MMITQNSHLPDIQLKISEDKHIKLSELKGQNVVLYFYPKDNTPGCTTEAQGFRDNIDEFKKLNTVIFGISKDSIKSHNEFSKAQCLPFDLASDDQGLCEMFGVWVKKQMYGKEYLGIERSTFLIDKDHKVRGIWRKVSVDGHVADVLRAIKELQ